MTTQEIAERLVHLVNEGKNVQAEEELYTESIKSFEQDPSRNTEGIDKVIAKTKAAFSGVTKVNSSKTELIGVNNDTFLVRFTIDIETQQGPMKGGEYGFYKVKEGKIIEEYFYFQP